MVLTRNVKVLSVMAVGLAAAAACSSSGGSGGGSAPPASSSSGQALSAQSTSLGTILVESRGRTVYVFANDKPNVSTCSGACAADWPPVSAPVTLPASFPGVTGKVGSIKRSDGKRQLTVASHPLYTFSGDSGPGQTSGQGITLNGGLWTAVLPSGAPDTKPAGGGSSANTPTY
jgi:predicted lipoprotein with Yx(FWY)xxD motif